MDFKPQANTNANRWYIKLPQNYENKESVSRQDVQGRPEKLRKLVELPRISGERRKPSICSISNEENEFMEKCKPQEIWQFGSVIVPRLEL
ncbi:uncharacterized protein Dwil_GK27927 [Drosophila willistoni]|uniref:Uncharacterized protein n=2 Tax=Drosophila willistoni TaxID=7260 RepID=A0A0Q9WTE2_DROWI|nr:uncharacterized protein Dwil_GK27927 [Drosophila willistoni]